MLPNSPRVAGLVMILLALIGAGNAEAARPRITFIGLRPTRGVDFAQTDMTRLGEAQRMRNLIRDVLELAAGEPLADSDEVRAILGRGYLAEVFDCAGRVPCLNAVLKPLAPRGLTRVVLADYAAAETGYVF